MTRLTLFLVVLGLSACATQAVPNLYNGQYYMAGDKTCTQIKAMTDSRIMCLDKDGGETGWRDAMTSDQLLVWHQQQLLAAAQFEATMANIRQNSHEIQQNSQQMMATAYGFSAPTPSIGSYGSSTTYTQVGSSLIGSNGITYTHVGNSVVGSDGSTCQIIDQVIICN